MVLCCTINGMPLVYSGQEAGLDRSLKFFEKDEIKWQDHENAEIYKKLFQLKKKTARFGMAHGAGNDTHQQ